MGLPIKKVLANVQQSLNSDEAHTARKNIDAAAIKSLGFIVSGMHTITAEEASDHVTDYITATITTDLDTKVRGLLLIFFKLFIDSDSPQAPPLDEVPTDVAPLLEFNGIEETFSSSACSGHLSNFGSGSGDGPWVFSGTCGIDTSLLQDPITSLILKLRVSWKPGAIPSGTKLQYRVRGFEIGA